MKVIFCLPGREFSGVFMEKDNLIREEFLHAIEVNGAKFK